MAKRNQANSSQNLRAAIGSAVVKKQNELKLVPSTKDYEDVSGFMVEFFSKNPKLYFKEEKIIPSLKKMFPDKTAIDRIGLKGRDEILSVLKEKRIIMNYEACSIKKDQAGNIISIERKDFAAKTVTVYRFTSQDEVYKTDLQKQAEAEYYESLCRDDDYW